jgi:glycosyltransferase A (GT-A) superfamily protein (DUF2064 family)
MELTTGILNDAFTMLKGNDAVIGPAVDGGYYLLGMNRFIPELFSHKRWSTNTVCSDTIRDLEGLQSTYTLLPMLSDIDTEADLPQQLR